MAEKYKEFSGLLKVGSQPTYEYLLNSAADTYN